MRIEALIFDVDGTLADTEEAHRAAFNLAFERLRLGWVWSPADYRRLLGVTGGKERIASHILSLVVSTAERSRLLSLVPEIHAQKTRLYSAAIGHGAVPLRDGVLRLMEEALSAGRRLAIASTTTAVNIDALLQATLGTRGQRMFSVIACGDQVRTKKPAPDVYRLALQALGLHPEQAVAFEDSANGLRSAQGAGLWTVVTPSFWTEGSELHEADLLLPHLGDPASPLAGEPGHRLSMAAWLTLAELEHKALPNAAATRAARLRNTHESHA